MLTVSLVGKKFSCSIQLQISTEKEGGGLELALKAGEKCNNCPQSVSNVNATLNITIQKGCTNYVTKCKEMLLFLQEQALPKTMNVMKVHMVNREMKNLQKDDARLFSCIKHKKRERERCRERSVSIERSTTRGYSSDTDQAIRHPCASGTEHLSRTDILATPRMSRHRLKNAALLRNRRSREASKERASIAEKEHSGKSPTSELKLKESRKNRSTAVRKIETEVEKEGSLIYEGSSESSLCDLTRDGSRPSKEKNNFEESEKSDLKTFKATESDMSADSLECLDTDQSKYQGRQKRRKKASRDQDIISQADRKSQPSTASIVPPLVLPSDFDDTSSDLSDANCATEQNTNTSSRILKTNSNLVASHDNKLYNVVKELAQEIIKDIISSAVKKLEKTASLEPNYENTVDECSSESFDDAYIVSREKLTMKRKSKRTSPESDYIHMNNSDKQSYSFANKDKNANRSTISCISLDGTISKMENGDNKDNSTQQQENHFMIGPIDKSIECSKEIKQGPTYTPRSTQTSPVESTFNAKKDGADSKEIISSGVELGECPSRDKDTRKNANLVMNNGNPVKLYDSHNNITKQIIHSVSRALHCKSKVTTSSKSQVLVPLVSPLLPSHTFTTDIRTPSSHASIASDFLLSVNHVLFSPGSRTHESEQNAIHEDLMCHDVTMPDKSIEFQLSNSLQQNHIKNGRDISLSTEKEVLGNEDNVPSISAIKFDNQDLLMKEFCKRLPYSSKEISSKINSSKDEIPTSGYCFFIIGPDKNAGENLSASADNTEKKDETMHAVESVQRRRKTSLYRRSLSHQNERKKWQTTDMITRIYHRSLSDNSKSKAARASRCASCPVLSEEDIVLEGLESHHQDICNSLSQRTWIALRVHELWKTNKHEEALKTCLELTKTEKNDTSESLSGSSTALDLVGNKDIVLFLNILQQLPIVGAAWTLDMCDLILAELKLFISTRIHTSHVEMACRILQVVIQKVSRAVQKAQTANKVKPLILSRCVRHIQDIMERASKVLTARRPKMYGTVTTEDPIALKPVLRELLTAIQTLMSVYTD